MSLSSLLPLVLVLLVCTYVGSFVGSFVRFERGAATGHVVLGCILLSTDGEMC